MIEIRELTKRYGTTTAVEGLTFTVQPGMVTGFLGPNGAGKSTTMRMIAGPGPADQRPGPGQRPDYRRAAAPLAEVGALLDAGRRTPAVGPQPPARPGPTNGIRRAGRGGDRHHRPARGRRRRAAGSPWAWASGWASPRRCWRPHVVLDEPVNGLDPEGLRWIRTLLTALAAAGPDRVRLLAPDERDGADRDQLVVVGRGRLIADTTVADFIAPAAPRHRPHPGQHALAALLRCPDVTVTPAAAGR